MPKVRTIFLSDIHLGTRACQAGRLLEFLRQHDAERIYLVGDIVDFLSMRHGVSWSGEQNTFVQKLLKRARHGVEVILVPGNHDEVLREHVGLSFGNIRLEHELEHVAADGKRYLVLHGDIFDQVTRFSPVMTALGDHSYELLMWLQGLLALIHRVFGVRRHWSLAAFIKQRVAGAVRFIRKFEEAAAHHALDRGFHGIVCGHIHAAANHDINGIHYLNCGDWVDSCSGIVEHFDGSFELVHFVDAVSPGDSPPEGNPGTGSQLTTEDVVARRAEG